MAATTTTALGELLKRFYSKEGVVDLQQFVSDFIKTLPKGTEKPGGEDVAVRFGVRVQRRQNVGALNQNEQFRDNEEGTVVQTTIKMKIMNAPIQITNFAIAAAPNDTYAFMAARKNDLDDALAAIQKDENRQAFGYGSGVLCLVNGTIAASTSLVVDTPGGKYLYPGMRIDISTSLTTPVLEAQNVKISSISDDGLTVTLATAVTVTNNSYIVRSKVLDSAPTDGKEFMGLQGIADDNTLFTTFQGVSRATYGIWKGTVIDMSSASITSDTLQRSQDKGYRRSGDKATEIWSGLNQRRGYLNLVTPQKRFQTNKLDAGANLDTLEWNGMSWNTSLDCQEDIVYMYPKGRIKFWELLPLGLDDSDGNTSHRIQNYDVLEMFYKHYGNVGCVAPASVVKIINLATLSE